MGNRIWNDFQCFCTPRNVMATILYIPNLWQIWDWRISLFCAVPVRFQISSYYLILLMLLLLLACFKSIKIISKETVMLLCHCSISTTLSLHAVLVVGYQLFLAYLLSETCFWEYSKIRSDSYKYDIRYFSFTFLIMLVYICLPCGSILTSW